MLADLLGEPVAVSAQPEAGALGAAIAAAVGCGHYPGMDEAAAAMVAPPRMLEPEPSRTALYRRRFLLWQAIGKSLAPHWQSLKSLADG